MKNLVFVLLSMICLKSFSQTDDIMVEEKSSAWIKVAASSSAIKPKATITKKTNSSKPATPKQDANQDFNKTNQQVNRFKKQKKG